LSKEYLLALIIFIAMLALVRKSKHFFSTRRMKFSLWFAIPFAVALWFGQKVVCQSIELREFTFLDLPLILCLIVVFSLMTICVFGFIDSKSFIIKNKRMVNKKRWLIMAGIIFACYLPLFLSFFPGIVSVDSVVQIRQAIGETEQWSNWHPVLHTAFMALPINIGFNMFGDLTAGIAMATLVQMIILSLIFGYVCDWAIRKTGKIWVGYAFMVFFALCPVVAHYAITLWKDVLFSAIFMLLVIEIYELIIKKKRDEKLSIKDLWKVFACVVLVVFLRNGGVLIMIALCVALLVYYRLARKIISCLMVTGVAIIFLIQGPVYGALGIIDSPFMESMSVPAQQMGYVAYTGELSDEEKNALSKYADVDKLAVNYSPMNADPAKNSFDYNSVNEDKIGFLKVWAEILMKHFLQYVKAYVLHTCSYWYPQGETWALDFDHVHDDFWLEEKYQDVALLGGPIKDVAHKIEAGLTASSWLGWMANVGVMFWGILFMLVIFVYQKKYYMLVPLICVLTYMVLLLVASPIPWIFRYVYSLLLILPVLITISFLKIRDKGGR